MGDALLAAAMDVGLIFAPIGVVLLTRTRHEGANRVSAFGVEFEVSTPPMVVLLAVH